MSHKTFVHYVVCPACEKPVRVTGALRCCILTAIVESNRVIWRLRPFLVRRTLSGAPKVVTL